MTIFSALVTYEFTVEIHSRIYHSGLVLAMVLPAASST